MVKKYKEDFKEFQVVLNTYKTSVKTNVVRQLKILKPDLDPKEITQLLEHDHVGFPKMKSQTLLEYIKVGGTANVFKTDRAS